MACSLALLEPISSEGSEPGGRPATATSLGFLKVETRRTDQLKRKEYCMGLEGFMPKWFLPGFGQFS